jgi:ADP-ribose pyrophosphatase YjhB (NUDIX family)
MNKAEYHNPTPVVVALIPVLIERGSHRITKLLAVRRNIAPKIGELALPGGYQEIEPVLSALFREVKEETDLAISFQSEEALVLSTHDNSRILMFFIANPKLESEINFSFENDETQELCLIADSSALAFPLHEKAVKWFYKKMEKSREKN